MNLHRPLRVLLALAVGGGLAFAAYERITDTEPRQRRREEVAIVIAARDILASYAALGGTLEIVDPLQKNRVAGKVFIYPTSEGWEVSGHYRRPGDVFWHAWLMTLDRDAVLTSLKVQDADPRLLDRARQDDRLTAVPRG